MWVGELDAKTQQQVRELAASVSAVDGIDPLNEDARFALTAPGDHLLSLRDGQLVGYLGWAEKHQSGQLLVDPRFRRSGIGTELLAELRAAIPGEQLRLWAFGDLPSARSFTVRHQLHPVRGLSLMQTRLECAPDNTSLRELKLESFHPTDTADLLATNAAAFAAHPEQGGLDAKGLASRIAEPWFDPADLLLARDATGLVGFHWMKRHDPSTAEVYVLGVHPRAQGRHYGRALLDAGLSHLYRTGIRQVLLYVDSDDPRAVRMYEQAGFKVSRTDRLYAAAPQEA